MAKEFETIPAGRTRRAAKTGAALGPSALRFFGSLATSVTRSPEQAAEILERRTGEIADHAVEVLGELRGGAMKVGQLASFVDVEFLPPQYRAIYQEKLAELRDSAPPMSWRRVRKVLEEEWDDPIESLFTDFDHEAVAAASIGQVHRAVLPDGRTVAVKVQYPEIADALGSDVETAAILIRLAKAIAPGLDPTVVAAELRERVLEELDYELEAQNQRLFARFYRDHPFIHVPQAITSLSRRRVLVSEWTEGRRFREDLALPQDERDRLGEIIYRFYFGSMEHLRAFNTDSHPGNYVLREDGRVSFLDFGSVKHLDPGGMKLGNEFLSAASAEDAERVRAALYDLGYLRERDSVDANTLLAQALAVGGWYMKDRELTIDSDYVAGVITALTDPRAGTLTLIRKVKVPADELMLRRVETGVLAVLGQLRATANWHRILREITFGDEPATDLGRAERDFLRERGRDGH
jgi:predicted unusual protein kinase regulating ubiquinone biosynthesis (AarF/ABC1/UbiB family)